jgi:DNA repair protein RadA/Sms
MGSLEILAERHRIARERAEAPQATPVVRAADIAPAAILRVRSRIPTLDSATGGGFVRGAAYLIHGAPGSGKSTLIGQAAAIVRGSVYASSEEGAELVGHRFMRLGAPDQLVIAERDIHAALAAAAGAPFVVVDSVSTMKPDIMTAGEAACEFAQHNRAVVVMVCHETKLGQHAGPRQLEHLIDCTLALLREPTKRILVVEKNRFGPAPLAYEIEMTANGFR